MPVAIKLLNLKYKRLTLMTTTVNIASTTLFLKKEKMSKNFLFKYTCMICGATNEKYLWAADTKFYIRDITNDDVAIKQYRLCAYW